MRYALLFPLLLACNDPAAPAPAQPTAPPLAAGDPQVRYNVDRINAIRAQRGIPALAYDGNIAAFAQTGSQQLSRDHAPHAYFAAYARGAPFGTHWAENQGDPNGVPTLDRDPNMNARKQIDAMLNLMMSEGPGGGHYDNIVNPAFRRIGVGIVYAGGRLYLTNDFSD